MNLPIKPVLFAIIILVATVSTAYSLTLIDQIVHGTLYEYNLRFDLAWANPYWNLLRFAQILLGAIGISTATYTMFTVRSYLHTSKPKEKIMRSSKPVIITPTPKPVIITPTPKPAKIPISPSTTQPIASPPATTQLPPPAPLPSPSSVHAPAPAPVLIPSAPAGYIRCSHCRKMFTQPLRMLDFQGDRPRIINICPFCNEIIQSTPRPEEKEQNKSFQFKRKNGDQTPKTLFSETTS